MFFILQIVGFAFLVSVIVCLVTMAAVWYKRQTHVQLTPGQLAKDRVEVARAERDIAAINSETEFHQLIHDRILDARTDKTLPAQVINEITEVAGKDPLPSTLHQMGSHIKSHLVKPKVYDSMGSFYGDSNWKDGE